MKKIFAILLIIAMLLPMGIGARAETQKAEEKGFYMTNWGGYETQYDNVYDLPFFWVNSGTLKSGNVLGCVWWGGADSYKISTIAKALKKKFDAQPEGTRYINFCLAANAIQSMAEHVVYHDKAVEVMKTWLEAFLAEYKKIGGQLDGVIIDVEYIESHPWYLQDYYTGANTPQNKNIYADIVNDSRYQTVLRPLLVEYGFEFYANPSGEKSEIWTIYPKGNGYNKTSYDIWTHVMDLMERLAYREGVVEPLKKYYPDATVSDYQSGAHVTWEKSRDVSGGALPFNLISGGDLASSNGYAGRSASALTVFPGKNKVINDQTAYFTFMNDINLFRDIVASTPDGRFHMWLGNYEYNAKDDGDGLYIPSGKATYSGTPYYSEMIFHVGMMNPEVFLGFLIQDKIIRDGFTVDESIKTTSDILVELSRVAGYSDREAILQKSNWNGGYMLSGMYSGGRNIWRITPDTSLVSVEDFKIKDKAPTFRVGNLTITFPQGRIIEDGEVSRAGTCGYWVETPTGVEPVVTADADRYVNDPSLWVHFEDYTVGSTFSASTGLPADCWSVSGSAKIESGSNGNALALSNSATVKCKSLPKYITAGDAYAKEQGWEISITLPSGYKGTTQLLKIGDTDGGFKISGSKLYYDQSGTYKELSGVNLSAGTYILRRQLNFNNFTCNYAVFGSDGSLLGEVKNVSIKSVSLPVTETSITTSGSGKVLVDDLNMYPMGTSTVLELYETNLGKKLNSSTARTEETAYRMSWLNATNEYKIAYVYDAATRAVIRKVEMAPGMDGVVTGIYDPNGKSVTFAVEVQTVSAPETPNYDAGYFDWEPYGSSVDPSLGGGSASNGGGQNNNNNNSNNGGGNGNDATTPDGNGGVTETVPVETVPNGNGSANGNNDPQQTDPAGGGWPGAQKKMRTGLVILILCLSVAILGGGGFAAYWFVIKPKMLAKKIADPMASEAEEVFESENEEADETLNEDA